MQSYASGEAWEVKASETAFCKLDQLLCPDFNKTIKSLCIFQFLPLFMLTFTAQMTNSGDLEGMLAKSLRYM